MSTRRLSPHPCRICGQPYRSCRATQVYCSTSCAAKARTHAFYRRIGAKGGQTSVSRRQQRVRARLADDVAGLSPIEAFLAGARWQTKRLISGLAKRKLKEGWTRGWEAAIDHFGLACSPRVLQAKLRSLR